MNLLKNLEVYKNYPLFTVKIKVAKIKSHFWKIINSSQCDSGHNLTTTEFKIFSITQPCLKFSFSLKASLEYLFNSSGTKPSVHLPRSS